MTTDLLQSILILGNVKEVRFAPIYHSEYTTEFHLIDDKWNIEGFNLIYSDAREAYHYESQMNGYVNESPIATHVLTIAAYVADGVLVILS